MTLDRMSMSNFDKRKTWVEEFHVLVDQRQKPGPERIEDLVDWGGPAPRKVSGCKQSRDLR
jgi:hypothetical protein